MVNRGFTLIELLAVIVILAIIALIATPIIIGIINESREQANIRSAEIYVKTAQLSVLKKSLNEDFQDATCDILSTGNLSCNGEEIKVSIDNKTAIDGQIIFEDGEIVKVKNFKMDDKYYNYDSNKNFIVTDEPKESVCVKGTEGDYDIVTCGTEVFYIMDESNGKIKMLTKYNIDVDSTSSSCIDGECTVTNIPGTYLQSATAPGTQFSSTAYWATSGAYKSGYPYTDIGSNYVYDSNAGIATHLNRYVQELEEIGVTIETARLITDEEAIQLKLYDEFYKNTAPSWAYSTVYWTGVVRKYNNSYSYYIYYTRSTSTDQYATHMNYGTYTYKYPGLRPVIIISSSEVD